MGLIIPPSNEGEPLLTAATVLLLLCSSDASNRAIANEPLYCSTRYHGPTMVHLYSIEGSPCCLEYCIPRGVLYLLDRSSSGRVIDRQQKIAMINNCSSSFVGTPYYYTIHYIILYYKYTRPPCGSQRRIYTICPRRRSARETPRPTVAQQYAAAARSSPPAVNTAGEEDAVVVVDNDDSSSLAASSS